MFDDGFEVVLRFFVVSDIFMYLGLGFRLVEIVDGLVEVWS